MELSGFSLSQIHTTLNVLLVLSLYHATTIVVCQLKNDIYQYNPKVFNPHPYEALVKSQLKQHDPGPVVFPKTPGDDDPLINNRYNIVNIDSIRMQLEQQQQQNNRQEERIQFVNENPYDEEAREKLRADWRSGYDSQENEVLEPQFREVLSKQGTKFLRFSPQDIKTYGQAAGVVSEQKKPFVFSYKVLDRQTGDDFSHSQIQNAKDTKGEYRVRLPDGRVQIVSYTAGKSGYIADVKYIPNTIQNNNDNNVDIQRVPVNELRPRLRPEYGYLQNGDVASQEQQLISPINHQGRNSLEKLEGPTEVPVNYVDVVVTPSPSGPPPGATGVPYSRQRLKPTPAPVINYPKALYTTNVNEQFANYNPAAVQPPVYYRKYHSPVKYTTTPVPPSQQSVFTYVQSTPASYEQHEKPRFVEVHRNVPVVYIGNNENKQPFYTTVSPPSAENGASSRVPIKHAQEAIYLNIPQPSYRPPVLHPNPEIINYGDHGLFNPTDPNYLRQRQLQEHVASGSSKTSTTTLAPIVVADEEPGHSHLLDHSHKPLVLRRRSGGSQKHKQLVDGVYFIDKAQRDHIKK